MPDRGVLTREATVSLVLVGVSVVGLALWLPADLFVLVTAVAAMALVYFSGAAYVLGQPSWIPRRFEKLPVIFGLLFPALVVSVLLYSYRSLLTPVAVIFTLGLLFVFLYYWLVVPLALLQKFRHQGWTPEPDEWPEVTVMIPAYNEEHYVGECIDSVMEAQYPGPLTTIVVDDGSTDGTYAEASTHASNETIVVHTENGGKHAALNEALTYANTDIVVSVDADSRIHPDALTDLVREFERYNRAGAVAGNVKVDNRGSLVTNLQALEYIIGINTFRRALDLFGTVTVVPGALGAFRRDVLTEVRGYSADTVTEDFDLTIEILKCGYTIQASEAIVYTEAPDTWHDLYTQRRRWFQGNLQTLVKHREVFTDNKYGLLHRVAFPYVFLSMSVLPLLGVLVLALIVASLFTGGTGLLLQLAAFFVLLQLLLSILAIQIEGEQLHLAALAPLTLFGYKQFMDGVLIQSFAGLRSGDDNNWLRPSRIRQRVPDAIPETSEEAVSTDEEGVEEEFLSSDGRD